jgi:hypothetical protein
MILAIAYACLGLILLLVLAPMAGVIVLVMVLIAAFLMAGSIGADLVILAVGGMFILFCMVSVTISILGQIETNIRIRKEQTPEAVAAQRAARHATWNKQRDMEIAAIHKLIPAAVMPGAADGSPARPPSRPGSKAETAQPPEL